MEEASFLSLLELRLIIDHLYLYRLEGLDTRISLNPPLDWKEMARLKLQLPEPQFLLFGSLVCRHNTPAGAVGKFRYCR